jgi:hypothetical protein
VRLPLCEAVCEGAQTQQFLVVEQLEVILLPINYILSSLAEEANLVLVEA